MQNASGNTESSESVSGVYEKMIGCAPQEKIIGEQDKTITEQANTILNMQEEKEENNGSVPQSITEQTAKAKESEGLYTTCETQKTALQTKYNTDTAGYSVLKQDNARLIQEQDKLQQDYIALSNNSSTLVATIRENIDNKAIVVNLAADYIRNAGGSVHVDGLTCSKKSAGIYNLWIEGSHPNSFSTEEEQKITKHLRYFCKPGKFKCSQIIVK